MANKINRVNTGEHVMEFTLLSHFLSILCMSQHYCLQTAGVGMTKTAIMSQARIQRAKNKNSENVTKTRGGE